MPSPSRWSAETPLRPTWRRHGPPAPPAALEQRDRRGRRPGRRHRDDDSLRARLDVQHERESERQHCAAQSTLGCRWPRCRRSTRRRAGDGRAARAGRGTRAAPSGPAQLRRALRLATSASTAARTAASSIVNRARRERRRRSVFRVLYAARFPMHRMRPVARLRRQRRPLDGRRQHVSVQLPLRRRARAEAVVGARLRRGDRHQHRREPVHRRADASSRRRARRTSTGRATGRGMAVAGGVLVRAFASVGWSWGGRWAATPGLPALLPQRRLGRRRTRAPVACPRAGRPPRATGTRSASKTASATVSAPPSDDGGNRADQRRRRARTRTRRARSTRR